MYYDTKAIAHAIHTCRTYITPESYIHFLSHLILLIYPWVAVSTSLGLWIMDSPLVRV